MNVLKRTGRTVRDKVGLAKKTHDPNISGDDGSNGQRSLAQIRASAKIRKLIYRPLAEGSSGFHKFSDLLNTRSSSIFNENPAEVRQLVERITETAKKTKIPIFAEKSTFNQEDALPSNPTDKQTAPLWSDIKDISDSNSLCAPSQLANETFQLTVLGGRATKGVTAPGGLLKGVISELRKKSEYSKMTGIPPGFDDSLINAALNPPSLTAEKIARSKDLRDSKWTFEKIVEQGRASEENFHLLIKSLGEKAKRISNDDLLSTAVSVPLRMNDIGFHPTSETYATLFNALGSHAKLARSAYLEMRSFLISPNEKTYGALINSHIRAGDLSAAFSLARKMEDERIPVNVEITTMLINGLVESGRIDIAWEEFRDARTWKGIKPDEVLFTVMIKACVRRGEAEKALGIFEDLKQSQCHPTEVTFITLIDCLSSRADFAIKSIDLWREMQAEQMPMSKQLARVLLQVCSTSGDFKLLREVIIEMRSAGIIWNSRFYALAIKCAGSAMRLDKISDFERLANIRFAWEVLAESRRNSTGEGSRNSLTSRLMNEVIEVYRLGGFAQYCIEMLPEFARLDIQPTKRTWISLLKLFGEDLKDPGRFFALLEEHPEVLGDIESKHNDTCESLLHTALDMALKSRSSEKTLKVFQMMKQHAVFPSPDQAGQLAKVGRKIPELHQGIMALVNKQKYDTAAMVDRRKSLNDLSIEEHLTKLAVEGKTDRSPSVEQQVRDKYFDRLKTARGGKKRPFLPISKYHQLTKKGGELYAKKHDKPLPNAFLRDL